MSTHIRIKLETKEMLDKIKSEYESYDSVIRRLLEIKPKIIIDEKDREKMLNISDTWKVVYIIDTYKGMERVTYARLEPEKKK